ncbi:MAG: hypothetical protein RI911_589 [Candidatus Parcubacteria bacterium]|jgi:hypothetical protein
MSPLFKKQHLTFRNILFYSGLVIILSGFVLYVLFQARFLIIGPQITITSANPNENNPRVVTLTGSAKNITHMTLNGRQIFTDLSGNFTEALILENGYTVATLHAVDRYGRTTNVDKAFVYTSKSEHN